MNRHERRAQKSRSGSESVRDRPTIEQGLAYHQAGHLVEAEACYRAVLKGQPRDPQVHHLLGLICVAKGRLGDAIAHFRQALVTADRTPEVHSNLANALVARGDLAEAISHYGIAIRLRPDYAEALANRSQARLSSGEAAAAVNDLERAIALLPALPAAIGNLGETWRRLGRPTLAATWYGRALALAPGQPNLMSALGACLAGARQLAQALRLTRRALALGPGLPETHGNHGIASSGTGPAAVRSFMRALTLAPLDPGHALDLGVELMNGTDADAALPYLKRAIVLRPGYPEAWNNLGLRHFALGEMTTSASALKRAEMLRPTSVAIGRNYLQVRLHMGLAADAILRDHIAFATRHQRHVRPGSVRRHPGKAPLRVGIVSSDFRAHPLGRFLASPVAHRDPARMRITCYADVDRTDSTSEWFRSKADGWVDISPMSDEETAARMRADGLDVLVVSAGHFDTNRPLITAWRGAPVQVSFDAATSGLAEMDYWLTDPVIHPPGSFEPATERPAVIPAVYNMSFEELGTTEVESDADAAVFASFANPTRISTETIGLWSAILSALPRARLVLKYRDRYGSERLRLRLQAAFGDAGIDPARITFITVFETRERHLQRYAEADMALDTFPFNGASTSIEALFAGVPVLSLAGDRFVSRQTSSILMSAGLDEWSTTSEAVYVAKAVEVAETRHRLRAGRDELKRKVAASRLCDGQGYARSWEDLFERLVRDGAA